MLENYYLDPWEQTSVKSLSKYIFFIKKCIWKCRPRNDGHSVLGRMSSSQCWFGYSLLINEAPIWVVSRLHDEISSLEWLRGICFIILNVWNSHAKGLVIRYFAKLITLHILFITCVQNMQTLKITYHRYDCFNVWPPTWAKNDSSSTKISQVIMNVIINAWLALAQHITFCLNKDKRSIVYPQKSSFV